MAIKLEGYRSGDLRQGVQYRYFLPSRINESWGWDSPQISQLVENAAIRLGELNSFTRLVPDVGLFIQLHVAKEAVVSSRIEGTRINVDEVLLPQKEISPERHDDQREVKNYIEAMNKAIESLERFPLSMRLLKQAHQVLLSGVRGENKLPGKFRTSQNWIGGSGLSDAAFIPPAQEHVPDLMSDLEKFLHNGDVMLPALVRIGIAHYQFETIHPFLDGNGRIGRLLITLFLVSEGILDQPLLYLSSYFEKDKGLYYDNLTRVRTHDDMLQWLKYFLVGVERTAAEAADTLTEIIQLKSNAEQRIHDYFGRRAVNATHLLARLFEHPVINVERAAAVCGVTFRPANELITLMCEHGILKEITGQSRNRWFIFNPYIRLFSS